MRLNRIVLIGVLVAACASPAEVNTSFVPAIPSETTTSAPPEVTSTSSETPPGVTILSLDWDAPENDVVFNDSEFVTLHNSGPDTVDVSGWWITDQNDHRITFPSGYSIPSDGTLLIYTGPGDSTPEKYFAGQGQAIWNNSGGDLATLYDSSGRVVDTFEYSS